MIETLITLPVVAILIIGFFVSIYLLFGHFCLKYRTHEDVICAAEERKISDCEQTSRRWLARVLPFGHVKKISIHRKSDRYAAWIELELLPPIPIISTQPILLRREHWLTRDELLGRDKI